jgi:hypothetical protein
MHIYTKTIRHEISSKKTYAQWLHPDLVGVHFPVDEMQSDVVSFGITVGARLVKMYSFEVKKALNFGNIREFFFQAVSNSSWANEGYLVAATISKEDEFTDELKRLSASFGIGIIELDIGEPDSTEILFPAKFKTELDWDTINKLAEENSDFRDFLVRIKNDLTSKEVRKEMYDKCYSVDQIKTMIKE